FWQLGRRGLAPIPPLIGRGAAENFDRRGDRDVQRVLCPDVERVLLAVALGWIERAESINPRQAVAGVAGSCHRRGRAGCRYDVVEPWLYGDNVVLHRDDPIILAAWTAQDQPGF